eukprot:TRINITY_DN25296_c0_g1_i1.p1 TRINITY_DN25296_c0_g1~~TRINITY_DN25296_c0_g1_i1.p1  ORF type:complete len:475 (+),score=84.62 TRINITY_DN25296_c0_g1_i1:119-1543(+)
MTLVRKMSDVGAAMADQPWPEDMNMFDPNVTAVLWYTAAPSVDVLAKAFETHLWPNHRFRCCIEKGQWIQRHDQMDLSYHFSEVSVKDEAQAEKIAMETQLSKLDPAYPRWKVVVIRAQSPQKSGVVIHAHHSLGDGLGMLFALSPLMGVDGGNPLSKVPLPSVLLPPSARRAPTTSEASPGGANVQARSRKGGGLFGCIASAVKGLKNFFRGALISVVTNYDSELSINEPYSKRKPILQYSGKRAFTRFPPVSMAAIREVREKHDCTLNDVVMSSLTGAFRRYAMEVKQDPVLKAGKSPIEFKSLVMIALPRPVDPADPATGLRNAILFSSTQLPLGESSCAKRLRETQHACNDLKSTAYMTGLKWFTNFISGVAPRKLLRTATGESWSKHTLCVTNVPATSVPMTFPAEGGEKVQSMSVVIANVMSQVSVVTYNGNLYASLVADPDLIPQADVLGKLWIAEIKDLALAEKLP